MFQANRIARSSVPAIVAGTMLTGTLLFSAPVGAYPPPCSNMDRDADCLTNVEEGPGGTGTSPNNPDTDGDWLLDGAEVDKHRTDPLKEDTDGDTLSDWQEYTNYKTDPRRPDTDGDGKDDGFEVANKGFMDPLSQDPEKTQTTPGYVGPPAAPGAPPPAAPKPADPPPPAAPPPAQQKKDSDGDGLSDSDEVTKHFTNVFLADTDFDGAGDGLEVRKGTSPLNPFDTPSEAE
jgi:hypothetical protein